LRILYVVKSRLKIKRELRRVIELGAARRLGSAGTAAASKSGARCNAENDAERKPADVAGIVCDVLPELVGIGAGDVEGELAVALAENSRRLVGEELEQLVDCLRSGKIVVRRVRRVQIGPQRLSRDVKEDAGSLRRAEMSLDRSNAQRALFGQHDRPIREGGPIPLFAFFSLGFGGGRGRALMWAALRRLDPAAVVVAVLVRRQAVGRGRPGIGAKDFIRDRALVRIRLS
jgi:hypothetical protein